MLSALDLKYWIRSGSLSFMKDRKASEKSLKFLNWNSHKIYYRAGTSDLHLIYNILLKPTHKREYQFPKDLKPKIILDIGANIGITAALLSNTYPEAKIYCFEPVQENFEVLSLNSNSFKNVFVYPFALGNKTEEKSLFFSDDNNNFGGFSFFEAGSTKEKQVNVKVKDINDVLDELKIHKVDMIKIDTEGSEFSILTHLGQDVLKQISYISGELHGEKDFELLAYLSKHFSIATHKPLKSRVFMFEAKSVS